jgi:Leucine-rich repeat (LRR) protein
MKKQPLYIVLLLLVNAVTIAQTINFTDINFKNALLSSNSTPGFIAGSGNISGNVWGMVVPENYIAIDANSDGEIQQSEALAVTFLQLPSYSISNFSGIEYFTNLKHLNIQNNPITSLSLSALTQLENLSVLSCQLTAINLTGLVSLKNFNCISNPITNIDFSGLPNLQLVTCISNLISSLDFTANPFFNQLDCRYNAPLTSVKIKNGTNQLFLNQGNCLFDGNPNLHYICADAAEIPILQNFQATCAVNNTCVIDSACALGVEEFNNREASVFPNPSTGLVYLDNTNNSFKTVQVYNSIGQLISTQTLGVAASVSIDLSGCSKGVYLLNFQGEKGGKSCKVIKD